MNPSDQQQPSQTPQPVTAPLPVHEAPTQETTSPPVVAAPSPQPQSVRELATTPLINPPAPQSPVNPPSPPPQQQSGPLPQAVYSQSSLEVKQAHHRNRQLIIVVAISIAILAGIGGVAAWYMQNQHHMNHTMTEEGMDMDMQ